MITSKSLITRHNHLRKHPHILGIMNDSRGCRLCNNSKETLLSIKSWIVRDSEEEERGLFGFQLLGDKSDASSGKKLLELFNDHGLWLYQVTVKKYTISFG